MESAVKIRSQALDQAKLGGDPLRALALALVYVGDRISDAGTNVEAELVAINRSIERHR